MAWSSILTRHPCRRHGLGREDSIELLGREQAALEHQLTNSAAGGDGGFSDVRCRGVADVGAERRSDGGAALEQLARARHVGFDSGNAAFEQHAHRLAEDPARVQRVPRHHRHHHVQFELPTIRSGVNGGVAAVDLVANLVDHFRHRRIHFAGHDRRAGLHRG
jgi:hypothetical protein